MLVTLKSIGMIPLEEVASTMARNRARPPTPPRRRGSPSRLLETNLAEAAGATNGGGGGGGILKKNREIEKSNSPRIISVIEEGNKRAMAL